jgi:hypothetical protein
MIYQNRIALSYMYLVLDCALIINTILHVTDWNLKDDVTTQKLNLELIITEPVRKCYIIVCHSAAIARYADSEEIDNFIDDSNLSASH